MVTPMNLHRIARAGLTAAGLCLLAAPAVPGPLKRPVVVELYTSQGCASCVPADALLAKLTKRPDVLPLSLSVTYWDMLGWKDTLATEINTRRQKAYASTMGHSAVYTPQMIVDGLADIVGSREQQIWSAIDTRAQTGGAEDIPIALHETKDELQIGIGASQDHAGQPATVWLFHIKTQATVAIGGGENDGRTMTYHNVVGDLRAVGQWKGEPLKIELPRSAMEGLPHDAVAVVVQRGGYGHVVGAAMLPHPDFSPEL